MAVYTPTIGLEIHAELNTKTKMFCDSPNQEGAEPNTNICPVCMAHPGTLPVINKEAIRHVLKIGYALGGTIADFTEFDRKNYFYPDIPKGYQISQYDYPLVTGGSINGVTLTRIHLEEDTAKSTHDKGDYSLIDFNRAGVPLMELVTEPEITSGEQAAHFAKELQLVLRYLGAGNANMEKGQMRVEANISVSPDANIFGTKVEVKNLNSFRSVEGAIAYEIERHTEMYENGEDIIQETRGWDENNEVTFSQRVKETSEDYRYFPDPDLPKIYISKEPSFQQDVLEKELPELPWDRRQRYITTLELDPKTAEIFVQSPQWAEYYERVLDIIGDDTHQRTLATNYITSDFIGLLKNDTAIHSFADVDPASYITAYTFASVISMTADQTLSSRGTKDLIAILYEQGADDDIDPIDIAKQKGLIQQSDDSSLMPIIEDIIADNPDVVADYKNGNENVVQFLVGQGMKKTQGSANPQKLQQLLKDALSS